MVPDVAIVRGSHLRQRRPPALAVVPVRRAAWLILASDGPASAVPGQVGASIVRVLDDPRRFRDLLLAERPRIVVCAQPPADRTTLELVAGERRRRTTMRAVHLAPPEAVDERLAALDMGFDDALTSATPAAELVGRLSWLDAKARARAGSSGVIVVGDRLELDLAAHELRREGEAVHLRPKSSACWPCCAPTRAVRTRAASCSTASGGRAAKAALAPSTSTSGGFDPSSGRTRNDRCTWSRSEGLGIG